MVHCYGEIILPCSAGQTGRQVFGGAAALPHSASLFLYPSDACVPVLMLVVKFYSCIFWARLQFIAYRRLSWKRLGRLWRRLLLDTHFIRIY